MTDCCAKSLQRVFRLLTTWNLIFFWAFILIRPLFNQFCVAAQSLIKHLFIKFLARFLFGYFRVLLVSRHKRFHFHAGIDIL